MISILLGIVTSVLAEAITALNKKLKGTVLEGEAAFLITFGIAFIGAFVKEVTTPGFTWSQLADYRSITETFGEIFTVSQLYFMFIMKKLNLDVRKKEEPKQITTSSI